MDAAIGTKGMLPHLTNSERCQLHTLDHPPYSDQQKQLDTLAPNRDLALRYMFNMNQYDLNMFKHT